MYRAALRRGFQSTYDSMADRVRQEADGAARASAGLWSRQPSTWSENPTVQDAIANRLGWLDGPAFVMAQIPRLRRLADTVRHAGFAHVVLLGMGGSSLAPEVLRGIIGIPSGWPRLHVLDSTDPAAVRAATTPPLRTLYILASKSGTTIEPNSLAAHFVRELQQAGVGQWGDHFIAITDEGTELSRRAESEGFRDVFINPSDIGGRYSALSFFGMVPAALMGQDIGAIVGWGAAMLDVAREPGDGAGAVTENPAVGLGLLMAAGARAGRDKLTLVLPSALEPFGLWVEQLVAESTGKFNIGVVPVTGETLGGPGVYGADRLFVRLRLTNDPDEERQDTAMAALSATSRAPIVTLAFDEPASLGAEFVRWEVATAVAGAILGVNPFDEPNVKQAKDATGVLLSAYESDGALPFRPPDRERIDGTTWALSSTARNSLADRPPEELLDLLGEGDYLGLLAYLGPDPALDHELHRFRMAVRDRTRIATTSGFGPRYLHSTGQLHKGGPNTGVFVLITATPTEDLDVPGVPYSFGTLELAQALGDFSSLDAAGRRALHLHLPAPDARLLRASLDALLSEARKGPASE